MMNILNRLRKLYQVYKYYVKTWKLHGREYDSLGFGNWDNFYFYGVQIAKLTQMGICFAKYGHEVDRYIPYADLITNANDIVLLSDHSLQEITKKSFRESKNIDLIMRLHKGDTYRIKINIDPKDGLSIMVDDNKVECKRCSEAFKSIAKYFNTDEIEIRRAYLDNIYDSLHMDAKMYYRLSDETKKLVVGRKIKVRHAWEMRKCIEKLSKLDSTDDKYFDKPFLTPLGEENLSKQKSMDWINNPNNFYNRTKEDYDKAEKLYFEERNKLVDELTTMYRPNGYVDDLWD